MRKILISLLVGITTTYAQDGFKWEKTDTVSKTKDQLYSDTKLFIAKNWKSANDVIQNDDKENGIILIKGKSVMTVNFSMQSFAYTYNYTITFRMKDSAYKITIDDVYCSDAYAYTGYIVKIPPFEGEPIPKTMPGISKKKAVEMMANLKTDLQSLFDMYNAAIKKKDEW